MILTITLLCATGVGFWSGGIMDKMTRRYSPVGAGGDSGPLPVRILSAVMFGLVVSSVDFSVEWLIALPFVVALVLISVCDIRHMLIPDAITIPGIAAAAVLRMFIHPLPYWDYLVAALIGSGVFYLIALLMGNDAIGGGDIKLLALTGFVLGLKLTFISFLLFCFAGTIAGIAILLSGRSRRNMAVPFGPFIAAASIVSYFWGQDAIRWAVNRLIFIQ